MEKQEFKDAWLPLSDGFYRVAYSILGTEQDAREALQDDSIMIEREMLGILQKTVGTLPALQKTVFEMKFYRQMSYDEIVRHTGLSYVNVRVLVSRARKAVESALKGFAD